MVAIVDVAGVRVRPDLTGFRQELRAGLAKIDDDFKVNIRADLDLGAASRDLAAWRALESQRGTITQEVKIDRDKLRAGLGELAAGVGSAARLATSLALASSQAVFLANTAATVGPVLAATAGTAGLIPAALVAAAAPMATIKLGADGIKKAFEGSKDSANDLRSAVAATFERELQPSVRNVNRMLPKLQSGFNEVARELSDVANRSTEAFSRPERIAQINRLLGASADVTGNLGRAITPVVEGLLNIAEVGMPTIKELTAGAEGAAQRFRDWTASAEGAKQIESWIRGGIGALREIRDVASDVIDIAKEAINVAQEAGIGLDTGFGAGVARLKEFVQSAEGHATLRELADTIVLLSDTVTNVLGYALDTLGPPFREALNGFQELVQAVGPHLPAAIDLVGDALSGAGKIMAFVADVIDALPDGMVDAAVKAGVLYAALKKFGGLKIASSLLGSFSALPGVLGKAERDVAASGDRAGKGFGAKMVGALRGLGWFGIGLTIVEELTSGMFSGRLDNGLARALGLDDDDGAISGTLKLFKTGIQETIEALRNPGHTMFDDLIPQMRELAGLPPQVKTQVDLMGTSIDFAKIKAGELGGAFDQMTTGAWTFANDGAVAVGIGMTNMVGAIGGGMGQMQAATDGGWAGITGSTRSGAQQMKDAIALKMGEGAAAVAGGWAGITGTTAAKAQEMADVARNRAQQMKDALAARTNESVGVVGSGWAGIVGASNRGADGMIGAAHRGAGGVAGAFSGGGWYGIGTSIVSGIGAGVDAMAGNLAARAAAVAKKAEMAAKAALGIHSPSRVFRDEVGKMMMLGMADGIEQNATVVVSAVQKMSLRAAQVATQQASGIAQAAREILGAIAAGNVDVFEDFSFRGNSDLVRQFNDELADAFYSSGGVFNAESMAAFLRGVAAQGGAALTATHRIESGGIPAAVERALSGWNWEWDRQGILHLSRQAERDNAVGR